jgi:tRNA-dihydrouridine synthase A
MRHRFSVAPMMDWTDRHCRAFHRRLTRRALLYTEMVTADAIVHGDRARLLDFDAVEHPVALQLGGADPERLAEATRIGVDFGYDEINLNVGCPSDRVQSGRFGACLMREPALVADCIAAMRAAAGAIPVTVKCRLGVDEQDPAQSLFAFVEQVAAAGCLVFIVHARKAWLEGLSPKENREIPPLDYDLVRRLKAAHPERTIVLNGGLQGLPHARAESHGVDGVMLGRAAYRTPAELLGVDGALFGETPSASDPFAAVEAHLPYLAAGCARGVPLHAMTKAMLGLFHGRPGGRLWRRILSEDGVRPGAGPPVVEKALCVVREAARRQEHAPAAVLE